LGSVNRFEGDPPERVGLKIVNYDATAHVHHKLASQSQVIVAAVRPDTPDPGAARKNETQDEQKLQPVCGTTGGHAGGIHYEESSHTGDGSMQFIKHCQ
jgi:hypothetical protein